MDPTSGKDLLGIDLLAYPEKFDIALKLDFLVGVLDQVQNDGTDIIKALKLTHRQPDESICRIIFHRKKNRPIISQQQLNNTSLFSTISQSRPLPDPPQTPLMVDSVKLLTESLTTVDSEDLIVSSLCVGLWISTLLKGSSMSNIRKSFNKIPNRVRIEDAWKTICQENIHFIYSSLPRTDINTTFDEFNTWISQLSHDPYYPLSLLLLAEGRRLINAHKRMTEKCQAWMSSPPPKPGLKPIYIKSEGLCYELWMGWDIGVLHVREEYFLINRDLFLLWVNKMGELGCALLYTISQQQLFKHAGSTKLVEFLRICCRHLLKPTRVGNWLDQRGYSFPKTMEALGVGMIIHQEDYRRGWENTSFLEGTLEGLMQDGVIPMGDYQDTDIWQYLSGLTTPEITEIIGSVKLLGHPSIDLQAGLVKLHTRTHHDIEVDPNTIIRTRGLLKAEFCHRYYKRQRAWPPLRVPPAAPFHRFREAIMSGLSPLSTTYKNSINLTWEMWDEIEINECLDKDYWESPLEFLKDTAISPTKRSVLAYCYKNKLSPGDMEYKTIIKSVPKNKDYALKDSNRLVIQFLLSDKQYWESLNYRKLWSEAADFDELMDEIGHYWVIKLTPKERELKVEGRFFGASPVPERDRRIQTEGEVARMMSKYFPEQMLTATELEFNQKLIKFRNYRKLYPNDHVVQLCFDFQAWNNYMRSSFIDAGIGSVLDGIFNTHAYSRVMKFYEHALVWCDTQLSLTAWMGQNGGIEGLNQATWTLATLAGLKVALASLGYKYEVSVKGDDCRAAIMIPKTEVSLQDLNTEADRIKQALADYCLATGMHLKPEETFVSLSLIASSKQYQLDDIILPCGLKQAMKMAHHTNAAFPATQDIMADIMSSCHSACFQTPFVIQTWCIGVLISLNRLNLDHKIVKNLSTDEVVAFGLWPQVLGGPGLLPLEVFIVRGENDMLAITYSLYRNIIKTRPDNDRLSMILWNIMCCPDDKKLHYRLLLTDPYSLNRSHPVSPSQYLKGELRSKIKAITRNPMLKVLMRRDTGEADETLIRILVSMRPAHVKVMVAIYENSGFAILDRVLARVDNSSSVFALLGAYKGYIRSKRGMRVLKKASVYHSKQVQWWAQILRLDIDHTRRGCYDRSIDVFKIECPTKFAQESREGSWKIPITGITYPSLTVQFTLIPMSHPVPPEFRVNVASHCALYTVRSSAQITPQSNHSHSFFSSPPNPNPWIGGKTETKVHLPGSDQLHKSTALPRIESLLEVMARVKGSCPDIVPLIKWLIRMMIPLTDDDFNHMEPTVKGGSWAHRLQISAYSMTTTPNFRHNLLQLVTHDYDKMQFTHEQLSKDYTLNFLAMHIQHCFIMIHHWTFSDTKISPVKKYWAVPHQANDDRIPVVFQRCEHCIADVSDTDFTVIMEELPEVDISESIVVALPESDREVVKRSLEVLKATKSLFLMGDLNILPRDSAEFLDQANLALVNKMVLDAKRMNDTVRDTIPGGMLSSSALQSQGIKYGPFPMKFVNWMDPKVVARELLREAQYDIMSKFPAESIRTNKVDPSLLRGVTNTLFPIIKLFMETSAHIDLAQALTQLGQQEHLGKPLRGSDLISPQMMSTWIYEMGLMKAQRHIAGEKTQVHRIVTHTNDTMPQLLSIVSEKLDGIVQSAIRHTWQRFRGAQGKNYLESVGATSPCDVWCGTVDTTEDFIGWLYGCGDVMFRHDPAKNHIKLAVLKCLIVPCRIIPGIDSVRKLQAAYLSPHPVRALKFSDHINTDVFIEDTDAFSSLCTLLGFDVLKYLHTCEHRPPDADWIGEFNNLHRELAELWQEYSTNTVVMDSERKWSARVDAFATIDIHHMEDSEALGTVIDNAHRVDTALSAMQAHLQNPGAYIRMRHWVVNFHQGNMFPVTINAVPEDKTHLADIHIPNFIPPEFQYINWSEHLQFKGYSTSACCKLWEILGMAGIRGVRDVRGKSLNLADGMGGFATLMGNTYPNVEVYFNTLLEETDLGGGNAPDWIGYGPKRIMYYGLSPGGDLRDKDDVENILAFMNQHLGASSLLFLSCDLSWEDYEDDQDDYRIFSNNLARIISVTCGEMTVIVIRIAYVDWVLKSPCVLYLIDCCYQFRLFKPTSSRDDSLEMYLIVYGVSYRFDQWDGSLHRRRHHRYGQALTAVQRDWIRNHDTTTRSIVTQARALWRDEAIPIKSARDIEAALSVTTGGLQYKPHWDDNILEPVLMRSLNEARGYLMQEQKSRVSKGRHSVGIGGVRLIQSSIRAYLKASACLVILEVTGGWNGDIPAIEAQLDLLHSKDTTTAINLKAIECWHFLLTTPYWTNCDEHEDCLTSKSARIHWAGETVHLNWRKIFRLGCDIALQLTTIGWLHRYFDDVDDKFYNLIFRS